MERPGGIYFGCQRLIPSIEPEISPYCCTGPRTYHLPIYHTAISAKSAESLAIDSSPGIYGVLGHQLGRDL
jgi:hypothetical protein